MHYRNGREATNGDMIVSLAGSSNGKPIINGFGVLYGATAGNSYCNGSILPVMSGTVISACLCDCLHMEDLFAILAEKGLEKRPEGK